MAQDAGTPGRVQTTRVEQRAAYLFSRILESACNMCSRGLGGRLGLVKLQLNVTEFTNAEMRHVKKIFAARQSSPLPRMYHIHLIMMVVVVDGAARSFGKLYKYVLLLKVPTVAIGFLGSIRRAWTG